MSRALPLAHFGEVAKPAGWRGLPFDDTDDDMELAVTPPDVIAMLGFDPLEITAGDFNP